MTPWQALHVGFARCSSSRSRTVFGLLALLRSRGTPRRSGGGDAGGVPVMASRIHAPRSTGAVRFGYDVAIKMPPLPSRPQRFSSASSTRRKLSPRTAGDAVVQREPLVHERVLRRSRARARCGPRAARSSRNSSSSRRERVAEIRVELREQHRIGHDVAHAANVEPLLREVRHERLRRAGRRACASLGAASTRASLELTALREREQLLVGHAAPEEERQARRELVVIDGVDRARREILGRRTRRGTGTPGSRARSSARCGCRSRNRRRHARSRRIRAESRDPRRSRAAGTPRA